MNTRIAFIAICLLYFMLWMPLGQYDFLINNWMKIGTYAVPFLLLQFFASRPQETSTGFSDTKLISLLLLVAYLMHQYEEHWIDLYGNYYSFFTTTNELFKNILAVDNDNILLLTKEAIFVINTSLVWLVGTIAIWRSPNHLFPTLAMAGLTFVNALTHMIGGLVTQSYNPGLLTAVIVFIPLTLSYLTIILKTAKLAKIQIIVALVWAFLAHIIMVGGLLAANWLALFPEYVYFILLILWSVVPGFLFRNSEKL